LKRYSLRHQEKNNTYRSHETRIIGIDPGSIKCGYGLIKIPAHYQRNFSSQENHDFFYLASGTISLVIKHPLYHRLKILYDTLLRIIQEHKPHEMVVERTFFAKSVRAAFSLGQARGIALLAGTSENLNIYEYSALEVKKAITGYGKADKKQVQDMVMRILHLHSQSIHLSDDSADALALALCHVNTIRFREAVKR
jgi:crossover junction endodeoxyribonuclease RuvC